MDDQVARRRVPFRFRLSSVRRERRGQSLAEFALTLPVVLVLVLFGLDFGRVFMGWVTLTSATREAANFAAMNPSAWGSTPNWVVQAEYVRLVTAEAAEANCTMPDLVPDPAFPSGTSLGSPASVSITCNFHLITPIVADIVGDLVSVTSTSAFPVRAGLIEGIPTPSPSPTPTPTPAATATPDPSAGATTSPTPTPSPSPTATPTCAVPNMFNIDTAYAPALWTNAGFAAARLVFSPLVGPNNNYRIHDQSLNAGTSVTCASAMTVYDRVQH